MIIDCATCCVRHTVACEDCIVTALCGRDGRLELDDEERSAIDAMSSVGLVSPIRLVPIERSSGRGIDQQAG